MGTLTALVLATPLFGLSLTPPSLDAMTLSATPPALLQSADGDDDSEIGELEGGAIDKVEEGDETPSELPAPELDTAKLDKETFKLQLRKRARLAKIHRTLGITTWALTSLAVIAGGIQFHNLYGGKTAASTPCVQGNAWLGQDQCSGTPWFHALTGFAAGAAYFSTLGLAVAMPDPDNASVGDSKYAKTVRMHKLLRWVHLGGMVAQMVLGIVIANPKLQGDLNRASDYKAQRGLAIVHLSTGLVTLGALSWAGTIMLL
jgi:hypothetical protein